MELSPYEILVDRVGEDVAEELFERMKNGSIIATIIAIQFAFFVDLFDLALIAQIPILGFLIKLFCVTVLNIILWKIGGFIKWKVRGVLFVAWLFEIIPLVSLMPVFTLSMIWAHFKIKHDAHLAREELEENGFPADEYEEYI